jgi:Flp pilus assembly protein TadG
MDVAPQSPHPPARRFPAPRWLVALGAPTRIARTLGARLPARLRAPRRGVATLEFAAVASLVIIPLLIGVVDFGIVLLDYSLATRAQQAALMAALDGASNSAIQNAAMSVYGPTAAATTSVSVTTSWFCAPSAQSWSHSGTAYSTQPDCGPGYLATQYIAVQIASSQRLPIPLPGYSPVMPIRTSTMVRIQ